MTMRYKNSHTKMLWSLKNDDECEVYEISLSEFPAICTRNESPGKSEWNDEHLRSASNEPYDAIVCNLLVFDHLFKSKPHTIMPICSIETYENDKFDILTIDADLFTWETPLGTTFMEFKRLSIMEGDLFTYDLLMSYTEDELLLLWPVIESKGLVWTTIKEKGGNFQIEYMNSANAISPSQNLNEVHIQTAEPSYMPYTDHYWGLDKSNLEDERMNAEAEILFHKRLVRLMDISLEEWLELKYGDPEFDPMNEEKRIITSWLTRSFKEQFNEFMELKKKMMSDTSFNANYDPNDNDFLEWLASKFNNHKTMDCATKNALWIYWMRREDEEAETDNGSSYDDSTLEENIYEWYEELEDGELKIKALMEKALLMTQHKNQDGEGAEFCHWLERRFGNYHKLDCELMMRLENYWWSVRDKEASPNETWNNNEIQDNGPRTNKLIDKKDNEWKDDLFNELDINGTFYVDELKHELQFREVLRKLIMKYCKGWDNKKNIQRKMLNLIKKKINDDYESCSSDDTLYREEYEEEERLICEQERTNYEPHTMKVETYVVKRYEIYDDRCHIRIKRININDVPISGMNVWLFKNGIVKDMEIEDLLDKWYNNKDLRQYQDTHCRVREGLVQAQKEVEIIMVITSSRHSLTLLFRSLGLDFFSLIAMNSSAASAPSSSTTPSSATSRKPKRANAPGARTDVGWEYAVEIGKRRVQCKFCSCEFTGGIYRFKHHLARTRKDAAAFPMVPEDVSVKFQKVVEQMELAAEKKPKLYAVDEDEKLFESDDRINLYMCIGRMCDGDQNLANEIDCQMDMFKNKKGNLFNLNIATQNIDKKTPVDWWDSFGDDTPELKRFAMRVLSLTCSSSGCERNWSAFEMVHSKRRNCLHQQKMNDLVYVMYNLKLTGRQEKKMKEAKAAIEQLEALDFENVESDDEWITEEESTQPQAQDGGGDNDFLERAFRGQFGREDEFEEPDFDLPEENEVNGRLHVID
ncbi:zf-BED domain-containing protein [Artemisia annua]|uniref:Zf-BED domain-containing protein n=1 Tax=Artemisia annua TaxID=35608 RepID=A0A2U1NT64_ARTAN|nr:zf-BED domain-containing protein [Artemisia annua]